MLLITACIVVLIIALRVDLHSSRVVMVSLLLSVLLTYGGVITLIVALSLVLMVMVTDSHHVLFVLLASVGGVMVVSSSTWLMFMIALELQSFAMYLLCSSVRSEPAERAGILYMLLGALASAMVFSSVAWVMVTTGSLTIRSWEGGVGMLPLIVGLSWKVAAAPLYQWSIDVYDAVPTHLTAIVTTLPKVSVTTVLCGVESPLIVLMGVLSLVVGTAGLSQVRVKRLLAYSGVLNMGFILLLTQASQRSPDAESWWLASYGQPVALYLTHYVVVLLLTWVLLTSHRREVVTLSDLCGVSHAGMGAIITCLMLSMAGLPPFVGFPAKLIVMQLSSLSVLFVVVSVTIVATIYYLRVVANAWFTRPSTLTHRQPTLLSVGSLSLLWTVAL